MRDYVLKIMRQSFVFEEGFGQLHENNTAFMKRCCYCRVFQAAALWQAKQCRCVGRRDEHICPYSQVVSSQLTDLI